jgi:hypothetical protein
MDDSEATSPEQIRVFLEASGQVRLGAAWCGLVRFVGQRRDEVYAWTEGTLVRRQYAALGRAEKGVLRRYVARMTGLGRAQVTRLIASCAGSGRVKAAQYQRRKFATS